MCAWFKSTHRVNLHTTMSDDPGPLDVGPLLERKWNSLCSTLSRRQVVLHLLEGAIKLAHVLVLSLSSDTIDQVMSHMQPNAAVQWLDMLLPQLEEFFPWNHRVMSLHNSIIELHSRIISSDSNEAAVIVILNSPNMLASWQITATEILHDMQQQFDDSELFLERLKEDYRHMRPVMLLQLDPENAESDMAFHLV